MVIWCYRAVIFLTHRKGDFVSLNKKWSNKDFDLRFHSGYYTEFSKEFYQEGAQEEKVTSNKRSSFRKQAQGLFLLGSCLGLLVTQPVGADVSATMFGVVNVGIKHVDRVTKSYTKDILIAPTEAGPLTGTALDGYNRTSIQTSQSKFGWNFRASEKTTGVLELDMMDFNVSTPTTHILRVRKASFQHQLSEDSKIRIGKDFTIFNGVGPHTSNWVGGSYRAGNTGFISDEMVYFKTLGSFELGMAIGNFGRSLGEISAAKELPSDFSFPTGTIRLEQKLESGRWGLTHIDSAGAQWELKNPSYQNTKAWASKIYFDWNAFSANMRFAAYHGVNTSDLALFGMASSRQVDGSSNPFFRNFKEEGAFLSVQHSFGESSHIYWGLSAARIVNPEDGLNPNTLKSNRVTRLGYKYELEKGLNAFCEFTHFESDYALAAGSTEPSLARSTLSHLGFLYSF
jgi:hypothetical protein